MLKAIVSAVVFVEVLVGAVIPYLLRYFPLQDCYIGILNTFSGGVILATGEWTNLYYLNAGLRGMLMLLLAPPNQELQSQKSMLFIVF